jgi:hypothetical protein
MINLDAAADRDRVVGLLRGGIPHYGTLPDDEDRPKLLLAHPRREVKVKLRRGVMPLFRVVNALS